jgi:hypothetical protein
VQNFVTKEWVVAVLIESCKPKVEHFFPQSLWNFHDACVDAPQHVHLVEITFEKVWQDAHDQHSQWVIHFGFEKEDEMDDHWCYFFDDFGILGLDSPQSPLQKQICIFDDKIGFKILENLHMDCGQSERSGEAGKWFS